MAEEAVEATRTGNQARFSALLISTRDIAALGLSKSQSERLAKQTEAAAKAFKQLVAAGTLHKESEFSDFGGPQTGHVPAGTQGSTKDLVVYENVWAMVRNGPQHEQMQLGTMVGVGGGWKLVDAPALGNVQEVATGFFFNRRAVAEKLRWQRWKLRRPKKCRKYSVS